MITHQQMNATLRALVSTWVLFNLTALPLPAEEPYVQWAIPGGGPLAVTREGELLVGGTGKFNPQGQLVSSNSWTGCWANAIATDAQGNQYWTGRVFANGTFNYPVVQGFFVAKYGPTNNLLWVRNNESTEDRFSTGSGAYTDGCGICVDGNGNITVGGITKGSLKLGSFEADGESSVFFCKFDANGNLLWAKKAQSQHTNPLAEDLCGNVALDGSGNLIACGFLREGSSDFGGTTVYPGTSGHSWGGDWFLAKYSPNGDLLWVTLDYGKSLAVDKQGNIYVTFYWFKDGLQGIAKLNGNGALLWQKKNLPPMGGITLDEQGRPVFFGSIIGTAQFDAITLRSRGAYDLVVAKADVDGNILWAIAGGGACHEGASAICGPEGAVFLYVYTDNSDCEGSSPPLFDGISISASAEMLAKLTERPRLDIGSSVGGVQLSWPSKATNYVVEAATSLSASSWDTDTNAPTVIGRNRCLQLPATGNAKFFRLRKP